MTTYCGLQNSVVLDGFCALELPIFVDKPRSLIVDDITNKIFALERGTQSIINLFDSDNDGIPDSKQTVAFASGLNHGLAIHDGFIYASSDSTVYRWPNDNIDSSTHPLDEDAAVIVINNINEDGSGGAPRGHTTRTLEFDDKGWLYVSVGSGGNVDYNSYRSRIRRMDLSGDPTKLSFPQDFQTMEVFADGLRNEVGLAFDKHGALWGVENSADNLQRDDLGGDIHENNPAEELNRFSQEDAGKHYGYPYCWTEYELPTTGMGRGTVWAWPSFYDNGDITDEDCRNEFVAPIVSMQGHSAPLGITFFNFISPDDRSEFCNGIESFPKEMDGYAFIAFHGSWNRDVPTGYKVVYVQMDENGDAIGEPIDLLSHEPPNAQWEDGFRPVDVEFDICGRLLITSDGTQGNGSKVVRLESLRPEEKPTPTPNQPITESPSSNQPETETKSPSSNQPETETESPPSSNFSAASNFISIQINALIISFVLMVILG